MRMMRGAPRADGVVQATAIAAVPTTAYADPAPLDVCNALAAWAEVAGIVKSDGSKGRLAVVKSDLLNRLIYGGEAGPSRTPCPVHKGKWSGCHFGWPGSVWRNATGESPMDEDPRLREWWDAGCRCATHHGSGCTTGWNPDRYCCAPSQPVGKGS